MKIKITEEDYTNLDKYNQLKHEMECVYVYQYKLTAWVPVSDEWLEKTAKLKDIIFLQREGYIDNVELIELI